MTHRPPHAAQLPAGLTAGGLVFPVETTNAQGEFTAPDWVQLTPRGRVTARDGRVFVFEPERLAAAFATEALQLPIDFEHETEFTSFLGARPAQGWIVALEARPGGTFARVEWLPAAVEALKGRLYRYISPTFWRDEDGITARLVKSAALVASPALGMPAVASATTEDPSMLKELLGQLGLPETASAADATTAIAALKAGDPQKFVPKEQHEAVQAALATAQATIAAGEQAAQAARCEALVDDAVKAGKLAPAARAQYLALASAAFDKTKAAIEAMPVVLKTSEEVVDDPGEGATDPARLGALAGAYIAEQAAKGIVVTATEAVAHIKSQQGVAQ